MARTRYDSEFTQRLLAARRAIQEEGLSVAEAAHVACISPYHFHREFTKLFRETPHECLSRARFDRSREMLVRTESLVGEIVLEVGYQSLGSFSSAFARAMGLPPNEFRSAARQYETRSGVQTHRFVPHCFVERHWDKEKEQE